MLRGVITGLNKPFIVRGFKIEIPDASTAASGLRVTVADSVILHSSAAKSGTIFTTDVDVGLDTLSDSNDYVVGSFRGSQSNYVSLELVRETSTETVDQTSGWSESQKTSFQRTVPTATVLSYRYIINTSGFSTNLPLWIVKTDSSGNVQYITNCKDSLFRLGKGGSQPDPFYSYDFHGADNSAQFPEDPLHEWVSTDPSINPVSVFPGQNPLAFSMSDFAIMNLKEWMDAIMTRLKQITGSDSWSSTTAPIPSINNLWFDSVGSVMTGNGNMIYNMIYEITQPTEGAIQTQFTDSNIVNGDSYIFGVTSQNKALVSAFYNTQLLINSQIKDSWDNGEVIWNRRLYRPVHPAEWYMVSTNDDGTTLDEDGNRLSVLQSEAILADSAVAISSWSVSSDRYIEVVTSAAHGLIVGDYASLESMAVSIAPQKVPNGIHLVKEVIDTVTYRFHNAFKIDGTPIGSTGTSAKVTSSSQHPYMPKWEVTDLEIDGTDIIITAPRHTISSGDVIVVSGLVSDDPSDIISGRWTATVREDLRISFTVAAINGTLTLSNALLRPDSHEFVLSVADAVPDIYVIDNDTATVYDDASLAYVIGPDTLSAQPDASASYEFDGVVAKMGSAPLARVLKIYNYGNGSGNILPNRDGIHPQYTIRIDTDIAHGQNNVNDISFTINGDTTLSEYIRTYEHENMRRMRYSIASIGAFGSPGTVTVTTTAEHELQASDIVAIEGTGQGAWDGTEVTVATVIDEYNFTFTDATVDTQTSGTVENEFSFFLEPISGQGTKIYATAGDSWSNPVPPSMALEAVYIRYPSNPYAGPVQWTSDIIIKSILGDLSFTIPQTATANGIAGANRFNSGGLTGTVYLKNGEVAYIDLKRNLQVSSGATFQSLGGDTISGSIPLDIDGNVLEDGDFVKFKGETDVRWLKISGTPSTTITLVADNGQAPLLEQRPAAQGQLVYAKGSYGTVAVQPHHLIDITKDYYWLAMRRDNGSVKSRVYLRDLELEQGEVRTINDNEPSNLLIYTGAGSEAAVNPNYALIDEGGSYASTEMLEIGTNDNDVDIARRTLTFTGSPAHGFAEGDKFGINTTSGVIEIWTVDYPISSLTVVVNEDVTDFRTILAAQPSGSEVTYFRTNYELKDQDNLTLAQRKTNRIDAKQHTDLNRPVYDESILPLLLPLDPSGSDIVSGSYIYQAATVSDWQNPTALAWVCHGSGATYTEFLEGAEVNMPSGGWGDDFCLIHVISGNWTTDGVEIYQYLPSGATVTGRDIDNPGNPDLVNPTIPINTKLVLPPNRRTQIISGGGGYLKFGSNANYKASLLDALMGEELMVVINDTIRESGIDYKETFGGPKGVIEILRDLSPNSRLRFRIMPAYGSALIKISGGISLQIAYINGNIIVALAGRPVSIEAGDSITGGTGFVLKGSMEIDGQGSPLSNIVGGIFGPRTPVNIDQAFLIGKEANKPKEVWSGSNYVKTHTGYAGSAWARKTASHVTSGSSLSSIPSTAVTVAINKVARISMTATARRTDDIGGASFRIEGTFYNIGSGAVAAGSPMTTHLGGFGDGNLYAVAFGVIGDDVRLVTGGTDGSTIQWVFSMDYQLIEDSP